MKSVMINQFADQPVVSAPRTVFDRSHGHKTTFDAGNLIPFFYDFAVPGDSFKMDMNLLARLSTPVVPIMDNIKLDVHFFSVPNRLLWDNWERFNGAQDNPADSTDYLIPQVNTKTMGEGSIADYFGLPFGTTNDCNVNALPFRAINRIYNAWYKDQNLIDDAPENTGDGPDTASDYTIRKRAKRHDYFTSALPWPQKGDSIDLPLGTTAPVLGIAKANQTYAGTSGSGYETGASTTTTYAKFTDVDGTNVDERYYVEEDPNNSGYPNIRADLRNATAATINELRLAFQMQALLERQATSGTRYVEIIKNFFNVTSPDFRLQRPEYLGGGSVDVHFNPVAQTSRTESAGGETPQGTLGAFATAHGGGIGFSSSFTEHCTLIGFLSVRVDQNYQQGIERDFLRQTKEDFYWPQFAQLGEQYIENQELYFDDATPANNTGVFGYVPRYNEMRFKQSKVTGKFRSSATGSLEFWHLANDFASLPALNQSFIEENPDIDRILAVSGEPHFILDSYMNYKCVRPMPAYATPFQLSRF